MVEQKLKKAKTDPQKIRRNDPGRPEVCLVFSYHKKFNQVEVMEIENGCRSGELGCVDCKMKCSAKINEFLAPILDSRKIYENDLTKVKDIIADGEKRAKVVAESTMNEVRKAMKLG
jgi:tryptophanyl-tRNA synthetase